MVASLVLLTAARCGGDASSGSSEVASASAGGGAAQWRLTYSVDETGQEEVEATPASGGDGVKSTRRYRYSCRGEAILAAGDEEGTEFEGTPAMQCSYSASGDPSCTPLLGSTYTQAIASKLEESAFISLYPLCILP